MQAYRHGGQDVPCVGRGRGAFGILAHASSNLATPLKGRGRKGKRGWVKERGRLPRGCRGRGWTPCKRVVLR